MVKWPTDHLKRHSHDTYRRLWSSQTLLLVGRKAQTRQPAAWFPFGIFHRQAAVSSVTLSRPPCLSRPTTYQFFFKTAQFLPSMRRGRTLILTYERKSHPHQNFNTKETNFSRDLLWTTAAFLPPSKSGIGASQPMESTLGYRCERKFFRQDDFKTSVVRHHSGTPPLFPIEWESIHNDCQSGANLTNEVFRLEIDGIHTRLWIQE